MQAPGLPRGSRRGQRQRRPASTPTASRATASPMTCANPGLDRWKAAVSADRDGLWTYRVEGWSDPYGTWRHDADDQGGGRRRRRAHAARRAPGSSTGSSRPAGRRRRSPHASSDCGVLRRPGRGPRATGCGWPPSAPRSHAVFARQPLRELRDSDAGIPAARRAGARPVRRLVRDLPALRGRLTSTRRPASGRPAPSAPPRSGCPPSPRWASTSST